MSECPERLEFGLANRGPAPANRRGADAQPTRIGSRSPNIGKTVKDILPFGLQIGYGLTYQGSFAVNQGTLAAPEQYYSSDYLTHRAFASFGFGNGLTAQLNIQNATNERYYTGIRNNGWATPGEERSAVLSLFYSF